MNDSTDVSDLLELAKSGHTGVIMGGPTREGMSVTPMMPSGLLFLSGPTNRGKCTVLADEMSDESLRSHHLVLGSTRDGMRAFGGGAVKPDAELAVSGLMRSLLRRAVAQ